MAPTMYSSTTEMVERKVLEMAQHASFHQHVSYNLSTILHAFSAGKTDPTEIAQAFSRARGLEVITRVISGEPMAKPSVLSLCCRTAVWVVDKFGSGVSHSQGSGLVEALVGRLDRGVSGDDAQTVECQVECARLISSLAGKAASLLIDGGALGAIEGMLEQLGGNHSSIMRPCCEALERVSRTEEGRATCEERGTGGVLLATIRDFPEALEEGSDVALASALKVVERIFTGKSPEACALSLRAKSEEESCDDPHRPTFSDYDNCVETVLTVVEATPEAPGAAAATCLWWLSGASSKAPDRALSAILAAAAVANGTEATTEAREAEKAAAQSLVSADVWSWFSRGEGGAGDVQEEGENVPPARPVEGARFLAALCLCRPGLECLEAAVERESPRRVAEALVTLCESADPLLARACFRIIERLAKGGTGPQVFVDAGALAAAAEAGALFEAEEDAETVEDAEAHAIAAALGAVATLAEAGGKDARPVVDDAFQLSVRCLARVGEYSGRPAAAAAKSALDVITVRLTRSDRPKGAAGVRGGGAAAGPAPVAEGAFVENVEGGGDTDEAVSGAPWDADVEDAAEDVDTPMEILKDAGAIMAVMKAHPTDARVQQSGWRSLIAMDTGRGDVEKFWTGVGDGQQSRRQMLRDCLERHGGDSLVAGQVADILEGLVLQGDSDGDGSSLTASLSDAPGEESPRLPSDHEEAEGGDEDDASEHVKSGVGGEASPGESGPPKEDQNAAEEEGSQDNTKHSTDSAHPQGVEQVVNREDQDRDGGLEVAGDKGDVPEDKGAEVGGVDEATPVAEASEGTGNADVGSDPLGDAEGKSETLLPEDVLMEIGLMGTETLEGGGSSGSWDSARTAPVVAPVAEEAVTGEGSTTRPNVVRSLFGSNGHANDENSAAGDTVEAEKPEAKADCSLNASVVMPSKEELELRMSWAKLEKLHSGIVGRSQILGGESAQMAAAMAEPRVLKERVGALLEETEIGDSRDAFAAASLALVGALTAATGALNTSQKEVQRYLAMSRDLRVTSTWTDISEAMQWTMDSLKGTVILFTPHTAGGLIKALGLCKSMDSALKLFKEAALQIKIIVVELAGEHEPNTVWRVNQSLFKGLPENRKVMTLRHLRSLVVAYDHLSDEMRRDLTTALEIIKNREVLNMMGKYCIQAEAAEEKRREAKLATAEERLKVGRRPSGTRQGITPGRRSPPMGIRASFSEPSPPSLARGTLGTPTHTTPVRSNGAAESPGSGSSNGGNNVGGRASPPLGSGSRKAPLSTPRSGRSTATPTGCVGGSRIPKGVASHSRRRESFAVEAEAASSAMEDRRSRSPTFKRRSAGGRSKSPVTARVGNTRRVSRSLTPR
ncbi:unnamed protein product [Ectocarpus sp. CCAP 1310/34]|nr:unnamed protein product [Ectocarpus sp. CCAP 1310/34]